MSNALLSLAAHLQAGLVELTSQPASAPATSPAGEQITKTVNIILTLGTAALIIWLVRSISRPAAMSLSHTPGRQNRINPIFHILPLAFVAILTMLVAAKVTAWWWGVADVQYLGDSQKTLMWDVIGGYATQIPLLAGSLLIGWKCFQHGLVRGMGLSGRHWFCDGLRGVVGLLIVYPACNGIYHVVTSIFLWLHLPNAEHPMLDALSLGLPWKVAIAAATTVIGPVTEEMFFRGLLQSMFRQYLRSPWWAIVCTSVLFSMAHFSVPASVVPLALLGAALGYLYERTGRLLAPIIVHVLFNAISIYTKLGGG